MKTFILASLTSLSVFATVAYAGDVNRHFPNPDGPGYVDGYGASDIEGDIPPSVPAKPAKYPERLFWSNAAGAYVYRRDEKSFTYQPNAEIASAQCGFSLGTNNTPSFGKCPKERGAERVLDKDGTNYSVAVRETYTVCPSGNEVWHTGPCYSGQ